MSRTIQGIEPAAVQEAEYGEDNNEKVLDYVWSVAPQGATNGEIREATGITPHQQGCMLT